MKRRFMFLSVWPTLCAVCIGWAAFMTANNRKPEIPAFRVFG
jgi:hypothetical protein